MANACERPYQAAPEPRLCFDQHVETLLALLSDDGARCEHLADYLDSLDSSARWEALQGLGRAEQRRLWEKCSAAPAISLGHFVADNAPLEEVIHDGLNTLPVPGSLRRFQKRFCRPENDSARLFGYNEGATRKVIGPGYFVVRSTDGVPHWEGRGAYVVDYFQVPDQRVVDGWPTVVSNSHGLSRFVYGGTRDFMRRVSNHVSVGAAYKGERPLDHYFVLCRRPESK